MFASTAARARAVGSLELIGQVTGSSQTAPAVSGSGMVWTNLMGNNYDIFYEDVSARPPAPMDLTNTLTENEFLEDIQGNFVVWTHTGRGADGDIILYDLNLRSASAIAASNALQHFAHPSLGGRYVVFERITNQYDIDIYDTVLGAAPGPPVTNDPAAQLRPRVSGDVVVYEDYSSDPQTPAVYGYHVSTSGPPFRIAAAPAHTPDIDGNTVVYVGKDAAGSDQIYAYDLVFRSTIAITAVRSNKLGPRVSGSRIIWADDRNGQGLDVYSYDLRTRNEDLLAGGPGDQYLADIDGARVVYTSNASGSEQVFLFTFGGTPTTPSPQPAPLPFGCDPASTDLYDGPFEEDGSSAVDFGIFMGDPSLTFYVCVQNGDGDGRARASRLRLAVDGRTVLTPGDLAPSSDPPHYLARRLRFEEDDCLLANLLGVHLWVVTLYDHQPVDVTLTIRVAR